MGRVETYLLAGVTLLIGGLLSVFGNDVRQYITMRHRGWTASRVESRKKELAYVTALLGNEYQVVAYIASFLARCGIALLILLNLWGSRMMDHLPFNLFDRLFTVLWLSLLFREVVTLNSRMGSLKRFHEYKLEMEREIAMLEARMPPPPACRSFGAIMR